MKTHTRGLRHIWYDPYLRLWTLQRVDADDCQVGEVEYTTDRREAFAFLNEPDSQPAP